MSSSYSISDQNYRALIWTPASLAVILTAGRFYIRRRYSHLYWDDLFNGLAALCLIVYVVLSDPEVGTDYNTSLFWQLGISILMLGWTILYLVKASFLALCWLIFRVLPNFRRLWWMISLYTFLTYWPLLIPNLWYCGDPAKYADPATCEQFTMSPESAEYLVVWGSVATALHVSSDLLILGLPLIFIRNLQMSTAQKLSAGAVFALIAIDIVMGLMRNIIAATDSSLGDLTPNTSLPDVDVVLQTFEPSLAVIVCALPAYRSLLPTQQKRVNNRYESVQHLARPPTLTRRSARNAPLDDSITELERI